MRFNLPALHAKDMDRPDMPGDRPDTGGRVLEKPARDPDAILCKACGRMITRDQDRMVVQGAHLHTFANPQGLVFEIGCFQTAVGCAYGGELTAEFTWFAGYQWKIAVCAGCLTHLGWLFISVASQFNGLIIDRLVSGGSG